MTFSGSVQHIVMFTSFLKDMTKDTDVCPVKRYIWQGLGPPMQKRLPLWSWGCVSLPVSMCSPNGKLSKLHTLGIFMEDSSFRRDQSLTPFSVLFPSQDNGRQG